MSILINKSTRVVTQGITGKTGMFHTQTSRAYANGQACYVAGVNPKKAGENFEGIPIFATVKEAKSKTGVNTSVTASAGYSRVIYRVDLKPSAAAWRHTCSASVLPA